MNMDKDNLIDSEEVEKNRFIISLDNIPDENKFRIRRYTNNPKEFTEFINNTDFLSMYELGDKLSVGYQLDGELYLMDKCQKTVGPFKEGKYYITSKVPIFGYIINATDAESPEELNHINFFESFPHLFFKEY
ncbi:hypothetical protein FPHOBKDP_00119 [Listeria phage LPJP1]|nr:hypothetical protein FPHOBKDP_00119 [Listeria phage LPJP1]